VLPGAHFDCTQELPPLFDTLRMIHHRELDLQWQAPEGCRLPWDREDMLELLGNLLDNACKWAMSRVRLDITADETGYRLVIEDDGRGIPTEQRSEVLERGARLDERVEGHGLGLGIARDIVSAWNGELDLQQSALGGLRVYIRLPRRMASADGLAG